MPSTSHGARQLLHWPYGDTPPPRRHTYRHCHLILVNDIKAGIPSVTLLQEIVNCWDIPSLEIVTHIVTHIVTGN